MGFHFDLYLRRISSRISKRIQDLSANSFKSLRGIASWENAGSRKTIRGVAFFLGALVLGFWANSASESEAVSRWERSFIPSEKIVDLAMASQGKRPISDERQL